MNDYITLFTLVIVLALAIGLPIIYAKYNLNYKEILEVVKNALNILGNFNNKLDYEYKDIMQLIIDYCKIAVEYAEQLYKNGSIDKEQRKATAIKYVEESLALQNIELNDKIRLIIDATIEASVFLLPPTEEIEYIDER